MSLETGTYISDLVATNPTNSDPKNQGDDHLRFLKSTVKASFPNVTGAVTKTHTELNTVTDRGLIAGQTWTGTHQFPATAFGVTAAFGASGTAYATLDFVNAVSVNAALPGQAGNAGKILATNGATASWSTLGLVLLATLTPTAAAAAINALSVFTAQYDSYLIIGESIGNGTDAVGLRLQLAVAGTVDTNTANYVVVSNFGAGPATYGSTGNAFTVSGTAATAGRGCNFALRIDNVNDASGMKTAIADSIFESSTTAISSSHYVSSYIGGVVSGFSLVFSSGNFKATGSIRIYGIQKA